MTKRPPKKNNNGQARSSVNGKENGARLARFCTLPLEQTLSVMETTIDGLTGQEAEKRIQDHGPNELPHLARLGFWADMW